MTASLTAQLSQGFPATTGEAAKAKSFVHRLLTVPAPAYGKDKHLMCTHWTQPQLPLCNGTAETSSLLDPISRD